jgi:alpha-D-ribose 1-methylphosphonate 5-triphosphate synthase subunit PhnG
VKIDRKTWMSTLSKARAYDVESFWKNLTNHPQFKLLRAPEIGGVMVRGRMGAQGDAFNLGEMTVTRCSVQLDTGEVGHSYVQGRDRGPCNNASIILPLSNLHSDRMDMRSRKAAATKVDFFTMVRGEDS